MTRNTRMIVFLGPSLPVGQAQHRLDADYLPPCRMGDVYRACTTRTPCAIGIVDGYFEATPAVWHKEVLFALSQGIPVFGGGSMGALRAAELHSFGMRGVGAIFAAFASGALEDDDEVAVAHADAADGYRLTSDPMVNLRHGLDFATRAGAIDMQDRDLLLAWLKARHYPTRSWQALWDHGSGCGIAPLRLAALRAFVSTTDCDLKAHDACAVLDAMAGWHAQGAAPQPKPDFDLEPTVFWERLCLLNRPAGPHPAPGPDREQWPDRERLMDHLRVAVPARDAILREALLHHLVAEAAERFGLRIADDRAVLARFRRNRGLASADAFRDWMALQGLDAQACLDLARHEARLRAVLRRCMPSLGADVVRALLLRGDYAAVAAEVMQVDALVARMGIDDPSPDHVTSLDDVFARYQSVVGPMHQPLDQHVAELGFGSPRQFTRALIAAHLAATSKEGPHGTCDRRGA
jgi:hypothetical protein